MLRAVEIAHAVIKKGETPTPEGIKRAFTKANGKSLKKSLKNSAQFLQKSNPAMPSRRHLNLNSNADFYNRPAEVFFNGHLSANLAMPSRFNVYGSNSISYSWNAPQQTDLEKFQQARSRLNLEMPTLNDDDLLILHKKKRALPKVERDRFISELNYIQFREPYRYSLLMKEFEE